MRCWRVGVAAAVATTLVAALARANDVPLQVDGARIPMAGFAQLTLVGAAVGVVLAAAIRRRRRFIGVALTATALSLVPSLALPDHAATKVVLVITHLVAMAIVVPALAQQLPFEVDRSRSASSSSLKTGAVHTRSLNDTVEGNVDPGQLGPR